MTSKANTPGRNSASVPAIAAPEYELYASCERSFGFFRSRSEKVEVRASGSVMRGMSTICAAGARRSATGARECGSARPRSEGSNGASMDW